jgi:hypothetical protein
VEHVAGHSLEAVLRACRARGRLMPVAAALRIAVGALEGLEHAHGLAENGRPLGIVHGDLCPSNVMVGLRGEIKLLDFGMLKAMSRTTSTLVGQVNGRISYVSPEQVRGLPIDGRADLWGLGVTLFEALTNQRLFRGASEQEVMRAILENPVLPPDAFRPDVPAEASAIVRRALERDAGKRCPTAAAMRSELSATLARLAPDLGDRALIDLLAELFEDQPSFSGELALEPDPDAITATSLKVVDEELVVPEPEVNAGREPQDIGQADAPRRDRRRPLVALAAAALVLLGGLGAWRLTRGGLRPAPAVAARPAPSPAPAPVVAAPPTPSPAPAPEAPRPAPASPAPAAQPAAAPIAAPAAAGRASIASEPDRRPDRSSALRPLTTREAAVAFGRARPKILECFTRYSESVARDEGEMTLSVVVVQSGAVREAAITSAPVGSPALSECIVEQVKKLRFRSHPDKEVRINIPFVYQVKG